MRFFQALLGLLALGSPLLAQTGTGPVQTPQLNNSYFVGTLGGNQTILSTVQKACNSFSHTGKVVIPVGATPSDAVSAAYGCTGVVIHDERVLPNLDYQWNGSSYAQVSLSAGSQGAPGQAATISIGTVTTGSPGTAATVNNTGTSQNVVLSFSIPSGAAGATGVPPQLSIGTVQTLNPGLPASVYLSGTSPNYTINFGIPAGANGLNGTNGSNGSGGAALPNCSGVVTNANGTAACASNLQDVAYATPAQVTAAQTAAASDATTKANAAQQAAITASDPAGTAVQIAKRNMLSYGYSNQDLCTRVNIAVMNLPSTTLNGQNWKQGVVFVPAVAGGYHNVTACLNNSPFVSIEAEHGTIVFQGAGDFMDLFPAQIPTGGSTSQPSGNSRVSGFDVYSESSSATSCIHIKDNNFTDIDDVSCNGFNGATTDAGIMYENSQFFTEGAHVRNVQLKDNANGILVKGTSAQISFAYADWDKLRITSRANQIGIHVDNYAQLYHGSVQGIIELNDATATAISVTNTSQLGGNNNGDGPTHFNLRVEAVGASGAISGATFLNVDTTSKFQGDGAIYCLGGQMTSPSVTTALAYIWSGTTQMCDYTRRTGWTADNAWVLTFNTGVTERWYNSNERTLTTILKGFSPNPATTGIVAGWSYCGTGKLICAGTVINGHDGGWVADTLRAYLSFQLGATVLTSVTGTAPSILSAVSTSYTAGDIYTVDSSTNAATDSKVNITSVPRFVGTITTTANTSDAIAVTGLTTAGHCFAQQTSTGTVFSTSVQPTAATVTLTHSSNATAGIKFDMYCAIQ